MKITLVYIGVFTRNYQLFLAHLKNIALTFAHSYCKVSLKKLHQCLPTTPLNFYLKALVFIMFQIIVFIMYHNKKTLEKQVFFSFFFNQKQKTIEPMLMFRNITTKDKSVYVVEFIWLKIALTLQVTVNFKESQVIITRLPSILFKISPTIIHF